MHLLQFVEGFLLKALVSLTFGFFISVTVAEESKRNVMPLSEGGGVHRTWVEFGPENSPIYPYMLVCALV